MASRDEILTYIDELLDAPSWRDYGPNGLQVIGADEVKHVSAGVSASLELFERTADAGSQLLLVHHGLFWKNTPQVIDRFARRRLQTLFDNDITLAAYHLPLDAHPAVGNNALIAQGLGLKVSDTPFAVYSERPVGVVGHFDQPLAFAHFAQQLEDLVGRTPLHLGARPEAISSVAICSGGAQREIDSAVRLGVDAFVTGEASEPVMATAAEGGVAFFSAGHYATEVFGVRELARNVAEKFDLGHVFHHIPNPV